MTTTQINPTAVTYHDLNAMLNLYDEDGQIQFDQDKKAARAYFLEHVNNNLRFSEDLWEKLDYLIREGYYEAGVFAQYGWDFAVVSTLTEEQEIDRAEGPGHDLSFIKTAYKRAAKGRHRFATFLGAFKFYTSYALKSFDGRTYMERFEDRVVVTALGLAGGDEKLALRLIDEMISGRFQPATPTFQNMGKAQRGELVSCFLLRAEDNIESIFNRITSSAQLSKAGGGVAISLTNIRGFGAPIKRVENASSGLIPWMKLLEDTFSGVNQLGQRQGAGAVYLHMNHPDIERFLDTKRENADEKVRMKTLSLGVVIPDIAFKIAARKDDQTMYLFAPETVQAEYGVPFSEISVTEKYDEMVANPRIKKTKVNARELFQTIAELQFESGYPYIVYEDTVNRANPIKGRITMSNLCSEILQVNTPSTFKADGSFDEVGLDISCNLGSLNIALAMDTPDFGGTIETAIRALTAVSDQSSIVAVPSVKAGNDRSHAIGLGQMNLHGFLGRERIHYGSPEAIDFTSVYFAAVAYHAIRSSNLIATERGVTFGGFEDSKYADGSYFDKYVDRDWFPETDRAAELFRVAGITLPSRADWQELRAAVMKHGIYNAYLQAVPPTGSISYINHSTSSIHPIASKIEIRKEGKLGRVYYPAPFLTNDNQEFYEDAYEIGYEKIIDTYAAATEHVDQGLSLTLFFKDTASTRDVNKAQIYAFKKGIKTIYYIRIRQMALEGTEMDGCVSCSL
jgi:ribonucleoside-diphosphate reductase alpha chain